MRLDVPKSTAPLDVAAAAKTVFGAILAGDIEIAPADVESPTLGDAVGAEAIFQTLAQGADLDQVFDLSTRVLQPFVEQEKRIDSAAAAELVPALPNPSQPAFEAAFLFGDFYALVAAKGKMALAAELELTMWYQRLLSNTRVKQAISTLQKIGAGGVAQVPSSRSVSSGRQVSVSKPEIKAESVKAEPVKAESVKAESVKAESVKAESVKADPETIKPKEEPKEQEADSKSDSKADSKTEPETIKPKEEPKEQEAEPKSDFKAEPETIKPKEAKVDPKDEAKPAPEETRPEAEPEKTKTEAAPKELEELKPEQESKTNPSETKTTSASTPKTKSTPQLYQEPQHPILPKKGERNILITSALPYVNNVPHLGNIIGSTLSADFFSRYTKARGYNSLYICGTDEYGTATETKAIEEGVSPLELCTKYHHVHKQVYDWFQIGFDHFGRTSTPQQTEIAQEIFLKVKENGFLEEQAMEQLYCPKHEGYLADRFVEGVCPKCKYDDARGDQCDSCGALLDAFELINARCKLDGASPERRETKHLFISLDKLQPEVERYAKAHESDWSKNAVSITNTWLRNGLHPRAITRDLKWGVPVPVEGYEDKVLYVWFDAPIGYPSITACYTDEWKQWWQNPENVKLYQFMGKDNVPFHTVIFPATELATRDSWTMLNNLSTTEYLQYEGGKFSKSRNLGVFGNNAQEIGVSPSVWRYYLACARPETADTQFSWADFVTRNNSELLANFGNFVNRVVKFTIAKYDSIVPEYDVATLGSVFTDLESDINGLLKTYNDAMENCEIREGIEIIMRISARGNQFLQDNKLDNSLLEGEPALCAAVIGTALSLIYVLSAAVSPYMPETSTKILEQLQLPARLIPDTLDLGVEGGHKLGAAQYLFTRIDKAKIVEWQEKFGGDKKEKEEEKPKKKKKSKKSKSKKAAEGAEGAPPSAGSATEASEAPSSAGASTTAPSSAGSAT